MATLAAHKQRHPKLPPNYVAGKSLWDRSWVMYVAAKLLCYDVREKKNGDLDENKKAQMRAYCMTRHLLSLTMWLR